MKERCLYWFFILISIAAMGWGDNIPCPAPPEVWSEFDPEKDPLEIEVLSEWDEDGSHFKEMVFTGERTLNGRTRVYAIYGAPLKSSSLPAVVHIHGGGQTAYLPWLKYWNSHGYAAISFDWCGKWQNREKYTDWCDLDNVNQANAGAGQVVMPSPKNSPWYHWTIAARRTITVLTQQPEVDPDKIGAFGISMGGSMMWYLVSFEPRVKAGCAVYGIGWNTYMNVPKYQYPDQAFASEGDSDVDCWRQSMESQAYGPYVNRPILFLNATNDQHGIMDRSFDTLRSVPSTIDCRWAYSPHFYHHIRWAEGQNLKLWMDTWLKKASPWPASPRIRLGIDELKQPQGTVICDKAAEVERVEVYYAIENTNAMSRYWRSAKVSAAGDGQYICALPVMDSNQYLFAFTNVYYKSGIALSSDMAAVIPSAMGAVATELATMCIYQGSEGLDGWFVNSPGTDPIPPVLVPLRIAVAPDGTKGFSVDAEFSPQTRKIGDPKWRGKENYRLEFKIWTAKEQHFKVKFQEHHLDRNFYASDVQLEGKDFWQTVTIDPAACKNSSGQGVADWSKCRMLILEPQPGWQDSKVVFTNFQWVNKP